MPSCIDTVLHAAYCLVLVLGPRRRRLDPAGRIAAALGLTPAEAAVALALAEGMTPEEIAERRGASIHTVRDQIENAMGRIGVRRQLDLAVRAVRAMLEGG